MRATTCLWTSAPRSDVGRDTLLTLGFGCFFFDYDIDGWQDIFVAMGILKMPLNGCKSASAMLMPYLFRNLSGGKFQEVTQTLGADFASPKSRARRSVCRYRQ